MSIADKLLTVVENEQKIHDEVVGQSDLIAQIKAKVNSLPEAGGGEKPTLFAPTIAVNSVSSELTITDNRNGDFVPWYDLYVNNEFVKTLTAKTATLTDYIEHTETTNVYVQSNLTNFNPSESNVVEWKYVNVAGTAGLAYSLSSDGTYASCNGIGEAIETDIVIAGKYEGVPVTTIVREAFRSCYSLTSVVIPDSVTNIAYGAFYGCDNLVSINIPDSVTTLGTHVFYNCSSLTSIVIGDSVTSIGKLAFNGCSSLTSVVIGRKVTSIGVNAFNRCGKLQKVDLSNHTSVPTLGDVTAFNLTHADLQIKVPASLIDQWKTATNWSEYADKIVTEFTNTL